MPSAKGKSSKPKVEGLRKRSQTEANDLVGETSSQKTISDLFSTTKQAPSRTSEEYPPSPPNKRLKKSHEKPATSDPSPIKAIAADEMYNFTTSKLRPPPPSEVVDLTTSPHASPPRKQANGMGRPFNLVSHTGPKKLVVKNLKSVPRSNPDDYANRVWEQLDVSLTALFEDSKLPYSLEELYKGVEFSCRQDRGPVIFTKMREKCTLGMTSLVQQTTLQSSACHSDIEVLRLTIHGWSRWNRQFDTIRSIFFYLDRSYLLHNSQLPSLKEMGTDLFRENLFLHQSLRQKILQGACDLVGADRKGRLSADDQGLLQEAIAMFHSLPVYIKYFEPRLLSESEQYFCAWAEQAIASNDLAGYVDMCDKLMEQESERSSKLGLEQTTIRAIRTYLEDILIDQRQNRLVAEKDVGDLLAAHNVKVLHQLFSLLQRRYLGEKLRQPFEAFINRVGSEIVFDEQREREMVARLLDFKRKLDTVWDTSFQRHEGLGHSLREAFENFINKSKRTNMAWGTDNPKPGEMIAKHVDAILKAGTRAIRLEQLEGSVRADDDQAESSADEDSEITRSLDQVLDLFRFVHGKAVFEAFYKRDLARRLLLGRSASSDAEKSMLTRLKSGPQLPPFSLSRYRG